MVRSLELGNVLRTRELPIVVCRDSFGFGASFPSIQKRRLPLQDARVIGLDLIARRLELEYRPAVERVVE